MGRLSRAALRVPPAEPVGFAASSASFNEASGATHSRSLSNAAATTLRRSLRAGSGPCAELHCVTSEAIYALMSFAVIVVTFLLGPGDCRTAPSGSVARPHRG